jgi:hypothetical protein
MDNKMVDFTELNNRLESRKTTKNKEIRMNIRIDEDLRDAFIFACKNQDTTAARELRDHMRKYVAKYGQDKLL